jgi:AGCS family alanine or glycine:cation symporter
VNWLFDRADAFLAAAVDAVWGIPLVILLISSGLYFSVAGRFVPIRRFRHAIDVIRGEYDDPSDPGQISHFQALSSALSATLGMGNIAGVAIAVSVGGPGAVFWMWIAGLVGMATKFFTCTLACLYRRPDSRGIPQGGPMYWIEVGLGPRFRPLAMMFAICGMIGCLALFQINQLASLLETNHRVPAWGTGLGAMTLVTIVILGGIVRVGQVASRIVPVMAILYLVTALFIIYRNAESVPGILASIVTSAFGGGAVLGGAVGVTMKEALITGVRRAAFSNEAGIGTAPLAHGAAKTDEPVREGLVAMVGPFIDTNVVCTLTALVVLSAGGEGSQDGVILTARAFEAAMPRIGGFLLTIVILLFSVSTLISYSYYSLKCAKYVLGEGPGARYIYVYLGSIFLGAVWSQDMVINLLDTAFALMAIPTVVSTLILSPRVVEATRDYFERMGSGGPGGSARRERSGGGT